MKNDSSVDAPLFFPNSCVCCCVRVKTGVCLSGSTVGSLLVLKLAAVPVFGTLACHSSLATFLVKQPRFLYLLHPFVVVRAAVFFLSVCAARCVNRMT